MAGFINPIAFGSNTMAAQMQLGKRRSGGASKRRRRKTSGKAAAAPRRKKKRAVAAATGKRAKFVKGSAAAKAHMAKLRKMRKR